MRVTSVFDTSGSLNSHEFMVPSATRYAMSPRFRVLFALNQGHARQHGEAQGAHGDVPQHADVPTGVAKYRRPTKEIRRRRVGWRHPRFAVRMVGLFFGNSIDDGNVVSIEQV